MDTSLPIDSYADLIRATPNDSAHRTAASIRGISQEKQRALLQRFHALAAQALPTEVYEPFRATHEVTGPVIGAMSQVFRWEHVRQQLESWVAEAPTELLPPYTPEEQRAEAARRILDAVRTNATKLDLLGLGLRTLPECLGELTALQTLDLSYNRLATLPDTIGNLTALQTLILYFNRRFAVLPETICNLTALQTLDLSTNRLAVLPNSIGKLMALQTLDLHNNNIAALPNSIGNLTALRTLILSANPIAALPVTWICQLPNLRQLDLDETNSNVLARLFPPEATDSDSGSESDTDDEGPPPPKRIRR